MTFEAVLCLVKADKAKMLNPRPKAISPNPNPKSEAIFLERPEVHWLQNKNLRKRKVLVAYGRHAAQNIQKNRVISAIPEPARGRGSRQPAQDLALFLSAVATARAPRAEAPAPRTLNMNCEVQSMGPEFGPSPSYLQLHGVASIGPKFLCGIGWVCNDSRLEVHRSGPWLGT